MNSSFDAGFLTCAHGWISSRLARVWTCMGIRSVQQFLEVGSIYISIINQLTIIFFGRRMILLQGIYIKNILFFLCLIDIAGKIFILSVRFFYFQVTVVCKLEISGNKIELK